MEMLQLRVFSLLSQYENMSTVAQILNTSQPQISKLLASLVCPSLAYSYLTVSAEDCV